MKDDLKGDYFPLHGSKSYPPKPNGMGEEDEEKLRSQGNLFQEPDSTLLLSSGMGRHWPDGRGIFANEAKNFLVRLHPKYPAHIKAVPALLWAQTSETLHVRVRLSRYPGGEYTMRRASPLVVNCTADGLFFSAEGDDVAAFFSTTVRWSAPLLADDCVAAEVDGLVALEARKAAPGWWTRLLGGAPTNRVEYANELEPRVGALRACAADGGCADSRECGRLCAATLLEPHKEEAEEIEDADE